MTDPGPAATADSLWWQILLLILLVLCNAFFAASEIAVISLNDAKLLKMAEEGNKKAKQVLKLTKDSSRFLATIQIGVTLAGFLTSAVAAQSLAQPLTDWLVATFGWSEGITHTVDVIAITLVMSYFSLVFGELVPKRVAMQRPEKLAFRYIGVLNTVATFTKPFVKLLSASTNVVVRLFGIDPHQEVENVTEEEIRIMVDVGEQKGVLEDSQKEMINNIFEFDDISAADIMTPRADVEAVDMTDGIDEAVKVCMKEGFSRLPVYKEDIDHITGVLYVKDLLPYIGRALPKTLSIKSLMRETYFVPETKNCRDLFAEMSEKHIQMAVIVDEYGCSAGIVTMEDLLESIVGNIQDEYDNEEEEVTQTGENCFEVDASINVDELAERIKVHLPDGDYETLGGFLMERLGRIPTAGELAQVEYRNVTFTVLSMDDMRIDSVRVEIRIEPPAPEDEDGKGKDKDKD